MSIYTKTGDKGTSSLYDGNRIGKDELLFEVLGDIDELSSHIGLLYATFCSSTLNLNELKNIQKTLQNICTEIATVDRSSRSVRELDEKNITTLEIFIDDMEKELPKLTKFILQGITVPDAQAHVCRSICRRVERHLWKLENSDHIIQGKRDINLENQHVNKNVLIYINRLSDYFFVLARYLCIIIHKMEEIS